MAPAFDQELRELAAEIPEMRARIGIPDQDVFGGSALSLRRAQLNLKSSLQKFREAFQFFVLGMRMLGTDIAYAGRLFGRAVLGNTLKPREVSVRRLPRPAATGSALACCAVLTRLLLPRPALVLRMRCSARTPFPLGCPRVASWGLTPRPPQALRRTIRDLFTIVPFTVIMIIPMTPVGHVFVFGLIQRYFPGFFPSQFNSRRQEMVKRYEELRLQLDQAQEATFQREARVDGSGLSCLPRVYIAQPP